MSHLPIEAINSIKTKISHGDNIVFVKYSKSNLSFLKDLLKNGLIQNFTAKSKSISVYLKFDQKLNPAINSFARIAKTGQKLQLVKSNYFISKTNFNILFANSKKYGNKSKLLDCLYFIK
jgi:ribosomal protein S8